MSSDSETSSIAPPSDDAVFPRKTLSYNAISQPLLDIPRPRVSKTLAPLMSSRLDLHCTAASCGADALRTSSATAVSFAELSAIAAPPPLL